MVTVQNARKHRACSDEQSALYTCIFCEDIARWGYDGRARTIEQAVHPRLHHDILHRSDIIRRQRVILHAIHRSQQRRM